MTYKEFIENILSTRGNYGISNTEYYEIHHIVPRCMGGSDDASNKVRLYAKEHYEAHRLLALENPDNEKLTYAWWCFVNGWNAEKQERYVVTAEEYEEAKIEYAKMISKKNAGENSVFYGQHLFGESNPHWGKKHTDETKRVLSELAKQRVMSDETKAKISNTLKSQHRTAWNKGKKLSPEHYVKVMNGLAKSCENRKIPVNQYDLNGKYIKTWESATEAGRAYNIQSAHITDCCNYKRQFCNGYIWRYESDISEVKPYVDSTAKEIYQIDKDTGDIIAKYKSIAEAARCVNGNGANISMVCSSKYPHKQYKGYSWKYATDVDVHFVDEDCDENEEDE